MTTGFRIDVAPTGSSSGGSAGRVLVKTDDFGAIDVPYELIELPWPPPATLRALTADDHAAPWR
ncbi:hypothetical protein [Microbacterium amylolyticum]|uniref:Uncharacterized protein n=1 Tax=Microbacterium amylolyticum TaxID=936337 RepID=A0ABS4ZI60_9MICO|nr:hypothetical protein [Microbacterium amylolyticum]MBP2436703.1 hypothetical protein [Microbacterium amylolyticum]